MLGILIRKEIREAVYSHRFLITSLLCLTVIPLSTYISVSEYAQRLLNYNESVRLYTEQSEGNIRPFFQAEGYRPPSPLSLFSVGLEYYLPNKVLTSRTGEVLTINEQGVDTPQSLLFGKVDFVYIVATVISLLALLFTFNSIAGEKEDGTLRLLMSHSIPRWVIPSAKILGNYLVFLLPFITSLLLSLLIILTMGNVPILSSTLTPAVLTILLVTLLFILLMLSLGTLVSTLFHRSITAIVTLLFIWAIAVLVIPKVSPMLAQVFHPIRSEQVFKLQRSMLQREYEEKFEKQSGNLYDSLAIIYALPPTTFISTGHTPIEIAFLSTYDSMRTILDVRHKEELESQLLRIDELYRMDRNAQADIAIGLSRLSPISSYLYLISAISSTGPDQVEVLLENAQRFQTEVEDQVYKKMLVKTYGGGERGKSIGVQAVRGFDPRKARVPQLEYQRHSFEEILASEIVDLLLLILFTILIIVLCYWKFMRYDLR